MKQVEMINLMERVISYESEHRSLEFVLQLFADLIATGLAWQFQGHYGREARAYIENGLVTPQGDINWKLYYEEYAL